MTLAAHKTLGTATKSAAGPVINELGGRLGITPKAVDLGEHRRKAEGRRRWRLQRGAQALRRGERVELCQRALNSGDVSVVCDHESGKASYSGLLDCGSVWCCPICADRITSERRRQLQLAMALWIEQGGAAYLVTFTFRHDLALPLAEGLEKMQQAQRSLKGKRAYKRILAAVGAAGEVKALEVTHGGNGWHPHVHMLVFAKPEQLDLLGGMRKLWAETVLNVGLGRVNEHGFDVRGGDYAAEYIAKFGKEPSEQSREVLRAWWSASHELTRGHTKQGQRMAGATPFTLLRWYVENGDGEAGALFVEFARTFKGRRQLSYSPGLKLRLDLFALESERRLRRRRDVVIRLDEQDWSAVLRHNARWEVLYVAERYGGDAARELVDRMLRSRGTHRGVFKSFDPTDGIFRGETVEYRAVA